MVAFLGHWGCFQKTVFFLLCASIIPNGFGSFNLVFLTDVPDHHCFVPDMNLTAEWRKNIIPITVLNGKQELSKCSRYKLDVVQDLSVKGYIPGRDINLTELEQEECVDGWSYSKDIYLSTVVTEFDLVCSNQWKQPFTSTVFFVGVLFGSFFSGHLSDRCRGFDWQHTYSLFIYGHMLRICCWIHTATCCCLFFEGLEISPHGSLHPLSGLHPPLVASPGVSSMASLPRQS